MISAWKSLFYRGTHFLRKSRPPTPQLTSLDEPEKYMPPARRKHVPLLSSHFSAGIPTTIMTSADVRRHSGTESTTRAANATELGILSQRPTYERVTSETGLLTSPGAQNFISFLANDSSAATSRLATPLPEQEPEMYARHYPLAASLPRSTSPQPSSRRLSQIQPEGILDGEPSRSFAPTRDAPSPPSPLSRSPFSPKYNSSSTSPTTAASAVGGSLNLAPSAGARTVRGRISAPIPTSFVHVGGAFGVRGSEGEGSEYGGVQRSSSRGSGSGGLGMHPVKERDLESGQ